MKAFKIIVLVVAFINAQYVLGQTNQTIMEPGYESWSEGIAYMHDGSEINGEMRFITSRDEGHLQVKMGDQLATLPPKKVTSFVLRDSTSKTERVFQSILTEYGFPMNSRLIFLEREYKGDSLSLYRRYLRVGNSQSIGKGFLEPILFLKSNNGKAYQISKGMKLLSSTTHKEWIIYEIDYPALTSLFGSEYSKFKAYFKSNKLNLSNQLELIEALKFMNKEEFVYNRKATPKKLRY